ncbi:MAG: cofactor-independent phosphoglycerate mutase [Chitinispirillaceae bacterium]|nr:cofactor-independent phosphoglycerate mutase [Chitinispirillaceae bacterium]
MQHKYALLVGDGMADLPLAELGGKTPLAYAATPNMDRIARSGAIGQVSTVPSGMPPGSDVANLSLMGYDPAQYYSGRAPIEAASMGIPLAANDTAFRCNLVTVTNGIMDDYSAGHIETEQAHEIIAALQKELGSEALSFYPGVSYRHLLILKDFPRGCACTPPHDISGHPILPHVPRGPGSERLLDLMEKARRPLQDAAVNNKRRAAGKKAATDIWLWGYGTAVTLPTLTRRYGISGSVISAVDLIRGLGVLAGLTVRLVQGATGYLGTNYAGKVAAACQALENEAFVFVHVEAPDETSHEGSLQKKIQAIEEFDRHIVGELLAYQKQKPALTILVAPDHATPIATRTHSAGPVPYAACGAEVRRGNATSYSEEAALGTAVLSGPELFDRFIKGTL